jgi:hypothetical protein
MELFHINVMVDMDMERLKLIMYSMINKVIIIRKKLVHIILKLIKLDALLMDLEVVDGTGNGLGLMVLDSANLNFMLKIIQFKSKDGLDSILDQYITNHKTSYS